MGREQPTPLLLQHLPCAHHLAPDLGPCLNTQYEPSVLMNDLEILNIKSWKVNEAVRELRSLYQSLKHDKVQYY